MAESEKTMNEPLVVLPVTVSGAIVTGSAQASILRQRFLEEQVPPGRAADDRPLIIDLDGVRILTAEAADELVAKFVERVQNEAPRVIAVAAESTDVLSAVNAALRDHSSAGYAVHTASERPEWLAPIPIGFVRPEDYGVLDAARKARRVTVEELTPEHADARQRAALASQLDDLVRRGLLVQLVRGTYDYPLPSLNEIRARLGRAVAVLA